MPSYLFSKQQEKLERSPFLIQKSTIILVKEEGAEKFGEKRGVQRMNAQEQSK